MEVVKEEEAITEEIEEIGLKVKEDGNHVGGMMDLLHLVDLGLGVHQGVKEIEPRHHLDVDHPVRHLDVEIHLPDDEMIHHLEGDVLMTLHLDERLLLDDVGMMTLHLGALGMIHLQSGESVTTPPLLQLGESEMIRLPLEVKPKTTIRPPGDVVTIRHLVEPPQGEMPLDPDPGRDHQQSLRLVDPAGVRVEVGAERGHHHKKPGGGGVPPHQRLEVMLPRMKWIRRMAMGTPREMTRGMRRLRS
jgi:hypothetical protein